MIFKIVFVKIHKVKPFLKKFARGLSQAFFPEGIKCNGCQDELPRKTKYCFCEKCLKKLTFCGAGGDTGICQRCGSYMENMSDYCQTCKFAERPFDLARGVLLYSGDAARLVKAFKSGDKYYAPYFADMMFDYYTENLVTHNINAACFVPCGKKRLKERGYNQSAELARLFCEKAKLPLFDCLAHTRPVGKQSLLTGAERAENVKGAFQIKDGFPGSDDCPGAEIKDKRMMLIDDVFTTGSTTGECSRVLKKAGAEAVYVFTLATGKGH